MVETSTTLKLFDMQVKPTQGMNGCLMEFGKLIVIEGKVKIIEGIC